MPPGEDQSPSRVPDWLRRFVPASAGRPWARGLSETWRSGQWLPNRWAPAWLSRISLADKCLVLFGGAVILIVVVALSLPWFRMNAVVSASERAFARELVAMGEAGGARRVTLAEARTLAESDRFVERALARFGRDPERLYFQDARWQGVGRTYRTALAERGADGAIVGVALLDRTSTEALRFIAVNTLFLLAAASIVLALALVVFYQITHRVILGPVRALKATSQQVRAGNLATRSDIKTGDEFQELAGAFNLMLGELQSTQDRLRQAMAAQDARLSELTQSNEALYDAAKLKGEFLASVSHELRTPLNSIIGFAELLLDIARRDAEQVTEGDEAAITETKRRTRYLEHIDTASRQLLELIESLLEMAKIEAGRVNIQTERVAMGPFCEALVGMIHPLASRKGVSVSLDLADDLPIVTTDAKKLRQVVFNFLSNAVKFIEPAERTGRPGLVVLRAERLRPADDDGEDRLRICVIDTGPGIAREDQSRIFEKFTQAEGGHTRSAEGVGLGLSIAHELAALIGGEIQLVSDVGRGSMFSVVIPVELAETQVETSKLENVFRGALAGWRPWDEPDQSDASDEAATESGEQPPDRATDASRG